MLALWEHSPGYCLVGHSLDAHCNWNEVQLPECVINIFTVVCTFGNKLCEKIAKTHNSFSGISSQRISTYVINIRKHLTMIKHRTHHGVLIRAKKVQRWRILVSSPPSRREGRKKKKSLSEEGGTQSEISWSNLCNISVTSWDQLISLWVAPSSLKGLHFFLPSLLLGGLLPKIRHRCTFWALMSTPWSRACFRLFYEISTHSVRQCNDGRMADIRMVG